MHEEKVMREGQRRHFEDGVILVDTNVIRVMVHQDCVTFNAMNKDGVEVLNAFEKTEEYLKKMGNVVITRDAFGDIHLIEVYYEHPYKEEADYQNELYRKGRINASANDIIDPVVHDMFEELKKYGEALGQAAADKAKDKDER